MDRDFVAGCVMLYDFLVAGCHAAAVTGYFDHLETFYLILGK
jgi:hypothetical protein